MASYPDILLPNKSNAHTKHLARSLLEYLITEAVSPQTAVKPFKWADKK
jgi:hypothetical protein